MDKNPGTLQNKVNPHAETHALLLSEARSMMLSAGDFRILRALASDCHHGIYPLLGMQQIGDEQLLSAVLKLSREGGEVSQAIDEALRDGQIRAAEFMRCAAELDDVISAALELRERLLTKVVDPEHLPSSISRDADV